jgi:isopentenyl-diphosphate delta-isomerase
MNAEEYYKQKQFIAEVDEHDKVIGKVEKWDAHKKGILHRGFTAVVTVQDQILLQHRKHPVFDNVFDYTFSSHPVFEKNELQTGEKAVLIALEREWNVAPDMVKSKPKLITKCKYKAFDDVSGFYEHEVNHIYAVELLEMPKPNYEYSYGFFTLYKSYTDKIHDPRIASLLAPWVNVMLKNS